MRPGTSHYLQKMLTFLRRIRRSLLESGRFRRYLLYAVGEVLLVMIGILLALQVNNWNQQRTNRSLEKAYLRNFLLDLQSDSICISKNIQVLEMEKKPGLSILNRLLNEDRSCCKDSIKAAIRNSAYLGWSLNKERSNATFNEIMSSGSLRLISNKHLRIAIKEYYSFWDHAYERQDMRKSNYPNLTYKIFDNEDTRDNGAWFYEMLNRSNAEIEFRMEFKHEMRYARFIENVTMKYLRWRRVHLKKLIESELDGSYSYADLPWVSWLE